MASYQTVPCEHHYQLQLLDQKDVQITIHSFGLLTFDYMKCSGCRRDFDHVSYCMMCLKCGKSRLCFKCYDIEEDKRYDMDELVTWVVDTNRSNTAIMVVSTSKEMHETFHKTQFLNVINKKYRFFSYDLMVTTTRREYFRYMKTGQMPIKSMMEKKDNTQSSSGIKQIDLFG